MDFDNSSTTKQTWHLTLEIQGLEMDRNKHVVGINLLMRSQRLHNILLSLIVNIIRVHILPCFILILYKYIANSWHYRIKHSNISVSYYHIFIQWNMSSMNLLWTNMCVRNKQVFDLSKSTNISWIGPVLKFDLDKILVYFGLDRFHSTTNGEMLNKTDISLLV